MNPRRCSNSSFTLVELLIVSVILSVVSLAIFSSFSSGLRIWKRVNVPFADEDAVIFLERLGAELRSVLVMKESLFQGTETAVEFPAVVVSRRMKTRTPGRISYAFKQEKEQFERSVLDRSAAFLGAQPESSHALGEVRSAKFSFYHYDAEFKRYEWTDSWTRETMPLAVRLELERKGGGEPLVRTFPIPVARKTYE